MSGLIFRGSGGQFDSSFDSSVILCTKVHDFFLSKTGFTKECMEKAEEMGDVTLVRYGDILWEMNKGCKVKLYKS